MTQSPKAFHVHVHVHVSADGHDNTVQDGDDVYSCIQHLLFHMNVKILHSM